MLRRFCILLLPLLITGQEFQCGTDKIQSDIAKTVVQFNCKDKVSDINKCCITHDGCYDQQQPRVACDTSFCACVQAASAGNPLCGFYTSIFCDTAKVFGEAAYKKVGDEKRRKEATVESSSTTTTTATITTTFPASTSTKKINAVKLTINKQREPIKTQGTKLLTIETTTQNTVAKREGDSRHKEDKMPGEKTKTLQKGDPSATTKASEKEPTSLEEDREVAELEARLAREEAELEEQEKEQRRILQELATRRAALRAELDAFRESQRRLWKQHTDEDVVATSEDTTLTSVTSTPEVVQGNASTIASTESSIDLMREERRLKRRQEVRERHEAMARKIEAHRARVLAAKILRVPTPSTLTNRESEIKEPTLAVTNAILEGSGLYDTTVATASWSDEDLIPEAE